MAHYFYTDDNGVTYQDPAVIQQARVDAVMRQKNQVPLNYPELAALARDHSSTPERAVLWDSLPASEKSLGASIVKTYSPKREKKNKLTKAEKKAHNPERAFLETMANNRSVSPADREWARKQLGQ